MPLRIGQQAKQSLRIVQQQVRSLVDREATCETERQRVGVKLKFRTFNRIGRRAGGGQLTGQSFAGVFDKRLAGGDSKLPEPGIGNAVDVLFGITTEVVSDEGRGESVKSGSHCRVGGEKVPRSSDGQCDVEGLRSLLHETAGAFQHGKSRMPFIHPSISVGRRLQIGWLTRVCLVIVSPSRLLGLRLRS